MIDTDALDMAVRANIRVVRWWWRNRSTVPTMPPGILRRIRASYGKAVVRLNRRVA